VKVLLFSMPDSVILAQSRYGAVTYIRKKIVITWVDEVLCTAEILFSCQVCAFISSRDYPESTFVKTSWIFLK
jgi:hypothetical protein